MDFQALYQSYIYFVLWALFAVFIALAVLLRSNLTSPFKKISAKSWIILMVIFLSGLVIRVWVFPHQHLMYIDEPWYMETAKNLVQKHQPMICEYVDYGVESCELTPKLPVWPFLLSIAFQVFGISSLTAFYFNSVIGSLTLILLFLLAYLLFRNEKTALWSALFIAVMPLHVLWSTSVETNIASVFFVLVSIILFLIFVQSRKWLICALLLLGFFFTIFLRPENFVLLVAFFMVYVSTKPNCFGRFMNSFYAFAVVLSLMFILFVQYLYVKYVLHSLAPIDIFFLRFFPFLSSVSFSYFFLIVPIAGLRAFDKRDNRSILFILTFFIFFFAVSLPLSAQTRMALTPSIFLMILSAHSLEKLSLRFHSRSYFVGIIALLVFALLCFFGFASAGNSIWQYNLKGLETSSTDSIIKALPKGCFVVADHPTVVTSISALKGISTSLAINKPQLIERLVKEGDCVVYFYDISCSVKTAGSQNSMQQCAIMLNIFKQQKLWSLTYDNTTYYLNKILGVN